jgi:hypothetical protein
MSPPSRKVQHQKHQAKYQPPRVPAKFFKNSVPTKLSKLGSHRKVQYQKYQPKYQPPSAGAGNLPIPARQPVLVEIPAPALPPNSSKMEFPPNHRNWVPAKRCSTSTKNTDQNTNHQVLVPETYRYQPDSQYW